MISEVNLSSKIDTKIIVFDYKKIFESPDIIIIDNVLHQLLWQIKD